MTRSIGAGFGDETCVPVTPRMALLFNGLAVGAVTMATLLPVAALGYWLLIGDGDIRQMVGLSAEALPVIAVGQRLGAALVALLTILPLAWALVRLRVCLVCFSRGKPFASEGIRALRDFALGSMLASIAQFFSHAAMSLVLTATAIAGHKQISLGISSQMLLMIMFAGVIAALAWAMEKAAAIAEENSQFI